MSQANNSVRNWRKLSISNPKPDLHNINALTKFGENPWNLLKLLSANKITDGGTDGRTHGHTDDERETIIPRHYRASGIKRRQATKNSKQE